MPILPITPTRWNVVLCSVLCAVALAVANGSHLVAAPVKKGPAVTTLFDGKSLEGWKVTDFGGQGEVKVEDGKLMLTFGEPLTGVTWTGKLPTDEYEITLEAMRVEGSDFFCALTFPVGASPCSLILGGWGGGVVGLSSINGFDASENETTRYNEFKNGRWYRVRLRVTPAKIEAWLDDEPIVSVERENRTFTVRYEVDLSRPMGLASYQTTAAIRKIELRSLAPPKPQPVAAAGAAEPNHPSGARGNCSCRGLHGGRCALRRMRGRR